MSSIQITTRNPFLAVAGIPTIKDIKINSKMGGLIGMLVNDKFEKQDGDKNKTEEKSSNKLDIADVASKVTKFLKDTVLNPDAYDLPGHKDTTPKGNI